MSNADKAVSCDCFADNDTIDQTLACSFVCTCWCSQ